MGGYLKPYGGQRKVGQRARGGLFFNGIVWRFIPGMVAGYMLNTFFAGRETVSAWVLHIEGRVCVGGFACGCAERVLQALACSNQLECLPVDAAQRAAKKGDPASGGGKTPIKIVDITEESKLKMVRKRASSLPRVRVFSASQEPGAATPHGNAGGGGRRGKQVVEGVGHVPSPETRVAQRQARLAVDTSLARRRVTQQRPRLHTYNPFPCSIPVSAPVFGASFGKC